MPKKIIAANWKMNLDYDQSLSLATKIAEILKIKKSKNEVIIFPDFISLSPVSSVIKDSQVILGAQDVAPFSNGAYTGEVDIRNIKQVSCKYVLVGHSERRSYFSDDNFIADKVAKVLNTKGVSLILCVGEKLEEKKRGETKKIIKKQLKDAFSKVSIKDLNGGKIIIAYEPVWAIGTGLIALPNDVENIHKEIKKMLPSNLAKEPKVIYGGSVNADNFLDFQGLKNVDGFLIGGASLKAGTFLDIAYNF
ncbi:MAG: triose-phosphate isomerase [Patescibacteria group bacterium]